MDLFEGLTAAQQAVLRHLGKVQSYPAKKEIFREADIAYGFYVVLSGEVEIYRASKTGEVRLAVMKEGETFGEMGAFVASHTRTAAARALTDVVVLEIPLDPLPVLKALTPVGGQFQLMQNIIRALALRLRKKDDPSSPRAERHVGLAAGGFTQFQGDAEERPSFEAVRAVLPTGTFAKWFHERNLSPGTVLFTAGDRSECMYFLREGRLSIRQGDTGQELATVDAPSLLGELGYFLKQPRSQTVRADTAAKVTRFPSNDLEELIREDPEAALSLLVFVAHWLAWLIVERETIKR